ncbi:hypothetical protein AB1Y20_015651 [Prymnesium parvum]|uniref:Pre-mRNA-processing factor 19 n=1 Tax=Prymnesium parvum TaxID=97485 RepID=A0AB34K155_PRYPA
MFCAISGNAPEHPVVSKTGHLFEQSVIEKYIEATGKCPVTGEELSASDLLPLKTSATVKPRPLAATSIPGMLSLFQNEWDALMLETYTLKQQLDTVRQELGHALYQHDAACRVIARLVKERDDLRAALADAHPSAPAAPLAPAAAPPNGAAAPPPAAAGLPAELVAKLVETAASLTKGRKKRQPPEGQASAAALAAYAGVAATPVGGAGAVCVDVHASAGVAAAGCAGGGVALLDCAGGAIGAQLTGHAGRVTCVRLHPSKPLVLSSSADGSARVWRTDGTQLHAVDAHTAEVSGCTLHATGEYFVTASMDKSWAICDVERGAVLLRVQDGTAGYTCTGFHPDGLILGTGAAAVVRIWDVKSQTNLANFEGHAGVVSCLAFSENGYYLATGSADTTVKIWDLRKLKDIHTIAAEGATAISSVAFDYSGAFLAVGGTGLSVYESKGWKSIKSFDAGNVTGVGFTKAASTIVAGTDEGVVKLYSASN